MQLLRALADDRAIAVHSRAVDHAMQTAMQLHGFPHHARHGAAVGDIGLAIDGLRAELLQSGQRLPAACIQRRRAEQHQLRAGGLARDLLRHQQPQRTHAPGDQVSAACAPGRWRRPRCRQLGPAAHQALAGDMPHPPLGRLPRFRS
jgi:hypothetical protein